MALLLEWGTAGRSGQDGCFWYAGERVVLHACDAIVAGWGPNPDSVLFALKRNAWAQAEGARTVARREYEASTAGRLELAMSERAMIAAELAAKTREIELIEAAERIR